MAAFSNAAFSTDAFSVDAFSFGTPSVSARVPGYDPKIAILRADDEKIIAYVEDFLRRQPWRR